MDPLWLTTKGFEIDGEWVVGYRTKVSKVVGNQIYEIREDPYEAPVFSYDSGTDCHPGIYLASLDWLKTNYQGPYVKVRCKREELLKAGDKWRAKRIWVVADVPVNS